MLDIATTSSMTNSINMDIAPVHSPERSPMVTTSSTMTGDAEMRFCANSRNSS
jgi:hypothetical protein